MWLQRFRRFWDQHLDALGTELGRGKRERRANQAEGLGADDSKQEEHNK
jgi:hypothetical protein